MLFEYLENGEIVKVMVYVDCNGFFYVVDCINGEFKKGFLFVDNIIWVEGIGEDGCLIEVEG